MGSGIAMARPPRAVKHRPDGSREAQKTHATCPFAGTGRKLPGWGAGGILRPSLTEFPMKRAASNLTLTSLFATATLLALTTGCSDPGGGEENTQQPVRDSWRVEHEGAFVVNDADNLPRIYNLTIGTPNPFGDNFLNRGDVIVEFTGEPDTIKIEFRRFTFAESEAAAEEEVFDKLSLWAFNTGLGTPKRPEEMDEEADCTNEDTGWLDGCGIYVYYDGLSQLERAGADIRVTLPPDYRQELDIITSDNLIEDTYPNHGNVCINNINANASVDMQSGVAYVKMAADASPAPACDAVGIADCTDTSLNGSIAMTEGLWSPNCLCAKNQQMGSIAVESEKPYSTDITIDVPAALWTSLNAENEAGAGEVTCPVTIDGPTNFVYDETQWDPSMPWRVLGDANKPSDVALVGGGFAVKLVSAECEPVAAVEEPKDWDPNVENPEADVRGFIEVCSGCLDNPCDDL